MSTNPLSRADTKIKVANAALAEIGVPPIASFVDNTHTARTLNTHFENVMDEAFGAYPWRFARRQATGNLLNIEPEKGFLAAYQIPPELITIWSVWGDENSGYADMPLRFQRFADHVSIDSFYGTSIPNTVTIEGTFNVGPSYWPSYFRGPCITFLAAKICTPITQDDKRSADLNQEAASKLKLAMSRDAQGRSPAKVDTSLFIRTRRSGFR